jgi:tetratricopeptide (TPR) repeat protein
LILLVLLLLAGRSFGQQDQSSELASLLAAAQQAQTANDFAAAAADYKQAVQLRPDIPELRANLGLMQHQAGDYPEAIRSFQQALWLKPSLYVPNLFLGVDFLRTGRSKEAIPLLLRAEKMNPTDPLPALTLGRAWSALGDYPAASAAYDRTIRINSKQSSAWFGLGLAKLNEVEADARMMTDRYADSGYAKALFAESLVKQSRYKQAAGLYKSVLASTDRPPCMDSEAGWLALRQDDTQGAEAFFKAERDRHPECSLSVLGEARLNITTGDNKAALQLLEQLWKRDRGFVSSNTSLLIDDAASERAQGFLSYIAQQQSSRQLDPDLYATLTQSSQEPAGTTTKSLPERAVGVAQGRQEFLAGHYAACAALLKQTLDNGKAADLHTLAACAFFTGDYSLSYDAGRALHSQAEGLYWSIKANEKLAFQSLAKFQQLEPNSARSHILLGDIYRQRERYDDAQKEYAKALDISPNDPAALLGLAFAYYGDSNVDKTIETTRKALAESPDDPEINLLLGETLITQHKFSDAEPFLLKALNAKPQMLPHVHALLGEAYASDGKTQDAIRELKLGADSDQDGSIHYQLARLYNKLGDMAAAAAAIQQMKLLQQRRREGAVIAVQETQPSSLDEMP